MNALSKNKILLTIIAVLLLTNITLLILLSKSKQHRDREPHPISFNERVRTEVVLRDEQMSIFLPKRTAFWEGLRNRFDEIKQSKQEFYARMYDSTFTDSIMEAKAQIIGNQQKELDLFVIRHFQDIRKICTPEQLPRYDSIMPGIITMMMEPMKKKKKH